MAGNTDQALIDFLTAEVKMKKGGRSLLFLKKERADFILWPHCEKWISKDDKVLYDLVFQKAIHSVLASGIPVGRRHWPKVNSFYWALYNSFPFYFSKTFLSKNRFKNFKKFFLEVCEVQEALTKYSTKQDAAYFVPIAPVLRRVEKLRFKKLIRYVPFDVAINLTRLKCGFKSCKADDAKFKGLTKSFKEAGTLLEFLQLMKKGKPSV